MCHGDFRPALRSIGGTRFASLCALATFLFAACSPDRFSFDEEPHPADAGEGGEGGEGGESRGGSPDGSGGTPRGGDDSGGAAGATTTGGRAGEGGDDTDLGGTGPRGGTGGNGQGGADALGGRAGAGGGSGGSAGFGGTRNCMGDPATNACSCSKDGDEADEECSATCSALARDLAHRYSFDGTGTTVDDTVGVAHGVVVNGALAGAGALTLTGGQSDQYVDLPNGIVSDFTNATLEVWVTWSGGEPWQRIFDFGTTNLGIEGTREVGRTYLMLTPYSLDSSSVRLTYQLEALTSQVVIDGSGPLPAGTMVHLVAVVDDDNDTMALYQDGRRLGCATFSGHLSSIDDVNSWFGRSQWATDPSLGGVFHEVRIYRAAITDLAVRTSFAAGPDPSFLQAVPQGARQTPK